MIQAATLGGPTDQLPIFAPPRPPQVSGHDWKMAVVNNPDPQNYVPIPLIGATALQARVSWQQERAKETAGNAKSVQQYLEFVSNREANARQDLLEKGRKYMALRHHLLEIMTKVEVARSLNKPLQPDEMRAMQALQGLFQNVERLRNELATLQEQFKTQQKQLQKHRIGSATLSTLSTPQKDQLLSVLNEQRRKLTLMTDVAKKDLRDVDLVGQRVIATLSR
jgi:nuclear pore complex protein Nup54